MCKKENKNLLSNGYLVSGIGWIYLIVGALAIIIGAVFYLNGLNWDFAQIDWGKTLFHVGEVLLVSVLLGSMVNASRYIGAFKQELNGILHSKEHSDELSTILNGVINNPDTRNNYYGAVQKIVFGKEFVSTREDIDCVWNNVTLELIKHKFPGIQKELLETLRVYFLEKENYYYKDHEIQYVVTWKDKDNGVLLTKERHTLKIISETKDQIKYDFSTRTCIKDRETYKCEMPCENITIDGVPCPSENLKKEQTTEQDDVIRETWYVILQGKTEYDITYYRTKEYKLEDDFFVGFFAQRLVKGLRVDFSCPKDIEALFIPRGASHNFTPIPAIEDEKSQQHNTIIRKYEGLLLYRQGFVISLFKK